MRLGELFEHVGLTPPPGADPGAMVAGVTEDSRRVAPGWVFVARPGGKVDGRRFISAALDAGAIAIVTDGSGLDASGELGTSTATPSLVGARLAEASAGSPSSRLQLVGVTGTNGKTTVATLAYRLAIASGMGCGLIGTVEIDDGTGVRPSDFTTPPAERLSQTIAHMVDAGHRGAAIEVSSHALDQHRVGGLRFAAGVYTNLTGDHLDYHTDMDSYAGAKAKLFESLPRDSLAIVNVQCPWAWRMVRECDARTLSCALDDDAADASAHVMATGPRGMNLRLFGPWGRLETHTPLLGAHNAMNLLQAFAICHEVFGIDVQTLAMRVPGLRPPVGRLDRVDGGDITVLVDFAHTDDALANSLRAARFAGDADANLWVVFGCGGDKDRTKRPRMGRVAGDLADRVVVTSDNPRTEDPERIIDEVVGGIGADASVTREADREAAIRLAIAQASPGDVMVIAGKGHELDQEISDGAGGTTRVRFDDYRIAREALQARTGARA